MSDKFNVPLTKPVHHHASYGEGDAVRGHAGKNIATDGAAKRATSVKIAGGMVKHTADGSYRAYGGDHASALDSISGVSVPAGKRPMASPGWGNGSVRSGNPMAHAPAGKQLRPVTVHPSMKKQTSDNLQELGRAVLATAIAAPRGKQF